MSDDPIPLQGDPVLDRARQLREAGVPLAEIEKYLASKRQATATPSGGMDTLLREQGLLGAPPGPAATPPAVKPDIASALARNRKNPTGDIQAATANPGEQVGLLGRALSAHALNAAQGLPGMEAFEAGMGSLGSKVTDHPMGYEESLKALRGGVEENVPPAMGTAEKMAFGGRYVPQLLGAAKGKPIIGAMTSTPSRAAGTLAAADVFGQADPNVDLGQRTTEAAGAVPSAMLLGKVLSMGRTAGKSMGSDIDQNLVNRDVARSAAAGPEYDKFRQLGDLGSTPKLDAILNLPVVRRALRTVQSESPTLAALPATDAEVLDAVYKRVGNKAFTAKFGVETGDARVALKEAINDAAQAKGGSYDFPVDVFHEHSQNIGGVERGRDALTHALGKSSTTEASLTDSPAALRRDIPGMTGAEQQGVREGIYGQAGRQGLTAHAGRVPLPLPSRALFGADKLANQFDPTSTATLMRLLGMANAPVANP